MCFAASLWKVNKHKKILSKNHIENKCMVLQISVSKLYKLFTIYFGRSLHYSWDFTFTILLQKFSWLEQHRSVNIFSLHASFVGRLFLLVVEVQDPGHLCCFGGRATLQTFQAWQVYQVPEETDPRRARRWKIKMTKGSEGRRRALRVGLRSALQSISGPWTIHRLPVDYYIFSLCIPVCLAFLPYRRELKGTRISMG